MQATASNQEFDASLSVYGGTCGELSCIVGTNPLQFVDRSVTWTARVGQTYYLLVNGENFNEVGTFTLDIVALECEIPSDARGLWYQYTPSESAVHVAQIEDQTFDTRLSIFLGACGDLACRRSSGPFQFVTVGLLFAAHIGRTEFLYVSGENFGEAGSFRLNLQVSSHLRLHNPRYTAPTLHRLHRRSHAHQTTLAKGPCR